nr:MFS transporter [Dactylosporangium thailandense]
MRNLRRNQAFVLLWTGQAVSALGSQVSSVGYVLLALALTGSAAQAGLVAALAGIASLALRLPAGVLADTRSRRAIVVGADAGRAAALLTVPIAGLTNTLSLWHLATVAVLDAALGACFEPAEAAALRHVVPVEQLPEAAARNQSRGFVATLLGPALGGLLFGLGRTLPFLVDAVSYALSALSLALIRGPLNPPARRPGGIAGTGRGAAVAGGLVWVWRQRFVRGAVLWLAGVMLVFQSIGLVSVVLARLHGAGPAEIGALFSIASAGGLAGALVAPRLTARFGPRSLMVAFGWCAALVTPLLCAARSPYLIGAVGAVVFFLGPAAHAGIIGHVLVHAPERLQGRVHAAVGLIAGAASPAGPLLAGVLLQWAGPVGTVAVYSALLLLLAVLITGPARAAAAGPVVDRPAPPRPGQDGA